MSAMTAGSFTDLFFRISLRVFWKVAAAFAVVAGITVSPLSHVWAQGPAAASQSGAFPNFDARILQGFANAGSPAARIAAVEDEAGARRTAIEAGWPGAQYTLDASGFLRSLQAEGAPLSAAAQGDAADASRRFLEEHEPFFGLPSGGMRDFRLISQQPDESAVLVRFGQTAGGLPVYNGQIRLTLNSSGQITQVDIGDLARGGALVASPALSAEEAVRAALRMHGWNASTELIPTDPDAEGRLFFENPLGPARTPIRVELVVFPLAESEARPAYRIFLEIDGKNWFELLLDAGNGNLLLRHNLYRSAAQGRVWKLSPLKGPREQVTFPEGWLGPGQTRTTGNNIDAYLDTDFDNVPDQASRPNIQNGRAVSSSQLFDFPAGEGSTGQNPRDFPAAAVTNLFYLGNEAHDYFYTLGFDEAAGNFQTDNFGRGGAGNDAVRVEAQDGLNGASFSATPDGVPPRAQFGLFDFQRTPTPTDDKDAAYEAQVVVHELAHGFTTRVVGGPDVVNCLNGLQSAGMSEGWSDYFAASYSSDPIQGAYLTGTPGGARRHSFEGYPFTYEHLGNTGWVIPHDDGEIWAAALWDIRKELGRSTADQLIARALKLTPCGPSMVDARQAVLQADANTGAANRAKLWEIFARHGLGNSARGVDGNNIITGTVFTAAFDRPFDLQPGNRAPVVTSQPAFSTGVGQSYQYNIAATDPDGDLLTYTVSEGPPGLTVSPAGRVGWTATFTGQRVKITVADGKGGRAMHGFYIPVITQLFPNQNVEIGGAQNSLGLGGIIVPNGSPALQFTMRGGSGNPDLLVLGPDGSVGGFSRPGSTETFSIAAPRPGVWLVQVAGVATYSGVSLKATLPVPTVLAKDTTLRNRSGDRTSETFYRVTVPPGVPVLRIVTTGGTGDADLFVKRGAIPACQDVLLILLGQCDVDEVSIANGNEEVIEIVNPEPGDWFINVLGFEAYFGLNLTVGFPQPTIKNGGVVLATQTPAVAQAPARSIISVYGDGFAPPGTLVTDPVLDGTGKVSTTLANTCLEINGNRSPMFAVMPTQVNAQISEKVMPGAASAVVIRGCGTLSETRSAPVGLVVTEAAPAFFNFTNQASGVNPIAAVHGGGPDLVGEPGLIAGAVFTPAEPNGIVSLFGTGFGGTNPPLPAGAIPGTSVPDGVARATGAVAVTVGGIPVPAEDVYYAGTAPCCAGLDELVIRVPANAPDGNLPVRFTIGGISSPEGPYITVKKP